MPCFFLFFCCCIHISKINLPGLCGSGVHFSLQAHVLAQSVQKYVLRFCDGHLPFGEKRYCCFSSARCPPLDPGELLQGQVNLCTTCPFRLFRLILALQIIAEIWSCVSRLVRGGVYVTCFIMLCGFFR